MLPRFVEAHQSLPAPVERDVPCAARAAARALAAGLRPGASVAITGGSRGIARIAQITGSVAAELGRLGLRPFIAMSADAVFALNRVKPHTILRGDLGSGLVKMVSVGLGKHAGAETLHARGLEQHVVPVAQTLIERTTLRGGIAVVENARDEVAHLEAVPPGEIVARDRQLLAIARSYMPHLPIEPLDVLVVRRMGKDISGAGIDPNVIGMHRRLGGEPDHQIETVVVLDLTPDSHGNAAGVGMADLITHRLRDTIGWRATSVNCLTSGWPAGMRLPFAPLATAPPSKRPPVSTTRPRYGWP